jgi:phytoene dehydrogenase-like protein
VDLLHRALDRVRARPARPECGERRAADAADIEQEFRISGGHWHHGDLAFDQFFMVRPVPGAAQYRTPLPGLYLCGAGCHPGGGVMGIAGRNAARQVLLEAAA